MRCDKRDLADGHNAHSSHRAELLPRLQSRNEDQEAND
jgi:hypothetical protein